MGVSAGIITIGSAIGQADQTRKANAAAERKAQAERNQSQAQYRRAQIQARREARIKTAQLEAGAIAAGAGGSSAEAIGVGSLQSQLASNLTFGESMSRFTNYIYDAQAEYIGHTARANFYGSIASTSSMFMK